MVVPKLRDLLATTATTREVKKKKHAENMRLKRAMWTEEDIKKNREQSVLRMQKLRQQKKTNTQPATSSKDIPRTRKQIEKESERLKVQKEKKRQYRQKLHPQKLRRVKEKDRIAKQHKRQQLKGQQTPKTCKYSKSSKCSSDDTHTCNKENNPESLNVLKETISSMNGRSQRYVKKLLVTHVAQNIRKKYGLKYNVGRALGVSTKYLNTSIDKKERKDAVDKTTHSLVLEEYRAEYNSINVPNVKSIKKDLKPKFVLQKSVKHVYDDWRTRFPDKKLSFSKFASLKPTDVKPQSQRSLLQCLCEYCENVRLKLVCVNKLAVRANTGLSLLKDVYKTVDICLCEKENGHYKVSCVQGKCVKCGTKRLVDHLQPLMTGEMKDVEVEWSIWDNVDTRNPKTGKAMTKRQVVLRKGTPQILVAELVEEVVFLSGHLFVAHWQQHQFAQLNKNVPLDCVVITADFAENYTCFQQNEIQGAHWAKDSVTVHPTVVRYNCAECPGEVVEEVVDVVSDDLQHDTHSVHEFLNTVFKHLSNERQLNINKAYVFTDGCAAQYKCKTAFLDTSMSFDDFGFEMERGYYGSRHGKNRCDGEGGVIKSRVARAVTNGEAIVHNAERFFEVSKQAVEKKSVNPNGSCNHNRRTVLWVGSESINHDRQDRQCKTVPGTRKLHSVRGISKGSIKTRWLSCFCAVCTSESDLSPCVNRHIVGDWASVVIKTIPAARGQVAADIEPALDVQSAPDAQPTPDVQPAPDAQPVLVVQPVLVAQPDPGVQPAPDAQPAPNVQPAPDAQPVLVAQPDPDVQPVLVAQPDPDAQPVLVAQPDPDLEISFAASEISIDADVIMTELLEDNSFDINIEEMVEAVSNSGDPCVPTSSSCLPEHKTKYQVGDFIVVALLAGKRSINYVAEIKEITTDEEVLLQYMQEVGDNLYMWPSKTDVSQESLQSVIKKLPSPSLVVSKSSSRRQLFKF